ncbi:MAG: PIN domain-containing protein [Bifidobacteriaceae bacterium]|jgi:predicted nucleic acid-binding protein|nr:PIN domain-containing protein [Bifidobacteriaceae bacterium]
MTVRFVDTNVLLYAISTDPAEALKAASARELLRAADLALSIQVLQEFYVQATRATRDRRLTHEQAASLVEAFARFPVQELTLSVVRAALRASERWGLSYWDGAIIEAARTLGCRTVLSEDLADTQDYGGVTVVNPFAQPDQI